MKWGIIREGRGRKEWETVSLIHYDELGLPYTERLVREFVTREDARKCADMWNGMRRGWTYIPAKLEK